MNTLLKNLMLGGSATALITGAAFAQATAPADNPADIETINSSASRLDLQGFVAPTPVTVIGLDTLNRDAQVQVGDEIRELPQIRGGTAIDTGSHTGNVVQINAGLDSVALRNLGAQRNLVLFDHQRVTPSSIQEGIVDLSLIPSTLVERVDVVTGGASAAWGSDAVTGVINIVINKTFEGFKGSVQYSDSTEVANPVYKASIAWGTSFLGGKGHTVFGADITHNDTEVFAGQVWDAHAPNGRGFVYNSAYCSAVTYPTGQTTGGTCSSLTGQPLLTYAYGLGSTSATQGGLVSKNTAGAKGSPLAANGLTGIMFVGADATPQSFNFGTVYNVSTCYNGCTNNQYGTGGWGGDDNPYHSGNYLSYTSYQITPDIKASVQLNYSHLTARIGGGLGSGTNRVVYADNPYLPDVIAQEFVCNTGNVAFNGGASTTACQTTLSNGYNPYTHQNQSNALTTGGPALTLAQIQSRPSQTLTAGFEFSGNRGASTSPTASNNNSSIDYTTNAACDALSSSCGYANKQMERGVFTLDGALGDDWSWTAYIQNSDARIKQTVSNAQVDRVNNALDAVRITSGNVGTSGLPVGSIQCRGLLNNAYAMPVPTTAPAYGITALTELAGCQPYDPFGTGVGSEAARNYVNTGLNYAATGNQGQVTIREQQAAGEFSMTGVLPWQLPAGEIGVAFGGDWRLERQGEYNIDAWSLNNLNSNGNFGSPFEGKLHAEEGFLEVDAPLLKDDIVENLNLNMAGRMTDYSFSGLVETWKLGLTSQINDDVKVRATWSFDIRQPDVYDLYAPGANSSNNCAPFLPGAGGSNGGLPNNCYNVNGGNPNLLPEKSQTFAAGVVLTPSWIDGLTASVDWYQIHIHGALYTPGQTEPVARCQDGELSFCSLIVFDRPGSFTAAYGCGAGGKAAACIGADTTSQIDYVFTAPVNAALLSTAGFDFALAYGFNLFSGTADVSANGNYTYDFSRTLEGITFQGAGATGGFLSPAAGAKFQGTVNMNYHQGPWSLGMQLRITGESIMDPGTEGQAIATQGVTYAQSGGVNVPTVGSGQRNPVTGASTNYNAPVIPIDLRAQYRWSDNITLFGAIDNVQDLPTDGGFLRRSYRLGVRWNY